MAIEVRAQPLKVLHIILSTATGGMENVVYNLACAHDPSRVRLKVLCLESIGPVSKKLQEKGVPSLLLPRMTPVLSFLRPRTLTRHIRAAQCDIVHTHSGCWAKVAAACAWIPRTKLVYTDHGRAFPDTSSRILADRITVRLTSRVVAVGEQLQQYLVQVVRLPAAKVLTIPNGVDTDRFAPADAVRVAVRRELGYSDGDVVVTMVARLAPVKNHSLLVRAFRLVANRCQHARLLIVGEGPTRDDLQSLVASLGLNAVVRLVGDRPDVHRLLAASDIATLSSASEGTSLTLLEALATGLPVVATKVGGNPTVVVDGRTGILVGNDPQEYAAALLSLLQSAPTRWAFGAVARETAVREFSAATMAKRYEDLYGQVAGFPPSSSK
jgi:sugar transferase (PEP-CTERM/EpsH1 system associated)